MGAISDLVYRTYERIEAAPAWLRPGFYGAFLVYGFMMARGGLIILPVVFVIMAFIKPHEALILASIILVVVPAAGFVGGLAYALTGLVLGRFGRVGRVFQFIAATWVYCVLLVFVIMPWLDRSNEAPSSVGENWAIATGMGLLFGAVLGISATD